MKKTFRWLLCVLMAVTMAGTAAMAACAEDNKPPAHTEHVDADGDGKCDECGKDMGKTPEDPNDPDNPDGPGDPDVPIVPTGTEYKFEAEDPHVAVSPGERGNPGVAQEVGATETYLGNFCANVGATITYYISAEADTAATLVVSVSKRTSSSVFTEMVLTQVNDDFIDSTAIVPNHSADEADWINFTDVVLCNIQLKAGENVISFTCISTDVGSGYNFNRMSLFTENVALGWGEGPAPEPEPEGTTYYFEAEKAESNGWGESIDGHFNGFYIDNAVASAHGGAVVRGLGENAEKGYYFEFEVESDQAVEYTLYLIVGGGIIVDQNFPLTVNGEPVKTEASTSGDWEDYKEYKIYTGTLNAGANVFHFDVKEGCLMNFDAIKIISKANLTGSSLGADMYTYQFEAEKAESNSWADGTDWLWRSPNENASNGFHVSHIDNAALEHPGEAWMSYTFTADKAAGAVFSFVYALGADNVTSDAFTLELNGEAVTPTLQTFTNSGWGTFVTSEFCVLNLVEGDNTVKITVNAGALGDIDYFTLRTEAVIEHHYSAETDEEVPEGVYKFEGEKAESNSWNDGTDWLWRSPNEAVSGGLYISNVENAGKDHPGEAWISYTFTSDKSADAVFAFVMAIGADNIAASSFKVELNGQLVTPELETFANTGWGNYAAVNYATLKLAEGKNTIKITVCAGAMGDIDYFTIDTDAVLTHNYS